jgi:murein DD-endopeptidase MepM/ murein hydrolase activator NlpD
MSRLRLFASLLVIGVLLNIVSVSTRTDYEHSHEHIAAPKSDICGTVADSHWTIAGSPYVVTCNATLNSGTLLIDPGVSVKFQPGIRLDVSDTLSAQGTVNAPIVFTSSSPSPARGDWTGLYFHAGSSNSVLSQVIVEYGNGISIDYASPRIDYATIRYNASSGIYLNNSQSTISHSTIISNTALTGAGVHIEYGAVTLDSNTISRNSSTTRGGGIYGYGWTSGANITVTNNLISHNSVGDYGGGGILFDSANGLISDNTITDNSAGTGYTYPGCGGGIGVSGASGPVVTIRNNVILRNTGDACGGVGTDAYTTITGNLIAWNTATSGPGGLDYAYPGGYHGPSEIPVSCNTIVNNTGPAGEGNGIHSTVLSPFHQNNIYGNSGFQFAVGTSSNISATQNYWGTTDSGQIAAGVYDHSDNPSLGVVSFSPFLSTLASCAPPPNGGQTYSISGRVTDGNSNPVSGVTVSSGLNSNAVTDASGYYTITGLITGTYTLTPIKSGYTFIPSHRTDVSIPPDRIGQNFTGTVDYGGSPIPFLDLPFDYGGNPSSFVQILQNWSVPGGKINSWFDHKYPDYSYHDDGLWIFNSKYTAGGRGPRDLWCYGDYCYDDHNGVDFDYQNDDRVRAAAAGSVVVIHATCTNTSDHGCGGMYGNYILIYHPVTIGNAYFTRYAHLSNIKVVSGTWVSSGYYIADRGNTGRGAGKHLHFGVYRDNGNESWDCEGVWEPQCVDKAVDPFEWKMKDGFVDAFDPWVVDKFGPVSYRLWKYDPAQYLILWGYDGGIITATTNNVHATIPPNAFTGRATFELSPEPVAGASAQLRSGGQSFWLRLIEWISGGASSHMDNALDGSTQFTLTQPITLGVTYTDTGVLHLDTAQLSLYRWDETLQVWQPLPSTLDATNHVVTATTQDLGSFDLQAPLLCPADGAEPDDSYNSAQVMPQDGTPTGALFDTPQDEDWFGLSAVPGRKYVIQTMNLATGTDTVLQVYDLDSSTMLASNDNDGGSVASRLDWQAHMSGAYFVRVSQASGSASGCDATYQLKVTTIYDIYLPLLLK